MVFPNTLWVPPGTLPLDPAGELLSLRASGQVLCSDLRFLDEPLLKLKGMLHRQVVIAILSKRPIEVHSDVQTTALFITCVRHILWAAAAEVVIVVVVVVVMMVVLVLYNNNNTYLSRPNLGA